MNTAKLSTSIYKTAMYGGRIFQTVLNAVFLEAKDVWWVDHLYRAPY